MKQTKTTKFLRSFLALAFAAVLCLGTILPALAAPVTGGEEGNHAKITLKKTLNLADNLIVPTATFKYTLTAVNIDDDPAQTTVMPAISIQDIEFGSGDAVTSTAAGVASYSKESAEFPANSVIFPRAGVYTYSLAETPDTYNASPTETMTYDSTTYVIKLYVKNGMSGCYVDTVEAWTTNDQGQTVTKTNPTPGSSNMAFVNNYSKTTDGGDPTGPLLNKLFLTKIVDGGYADQSKFFTFTVKVAAPSSAPSTTYKAYVINNADNTVVTSLANYNGTIKTDIHGGYIEFTSGSNETINLKHSQNLIFIDLPIGTFYEMQEAATSNYKGKVELFQGSGSSISYTAPAANMAVSTNDATGGSEARVTNSMKNGANYTNEYTAIIAPTGIIIDNLPFILLLAVAVGTLVLFIAVKARKRRGYTAR